jgi:hypothetical protein
MPSVEEVAEWMLAEVLRTGYMEQEYAVWEIKKKFGGDFVYDNDNGNLAISKAVLKEFGKISEQSIVWERSERAWRKREAYDNKQRMQE